MEQESQGKFIGRAEDNPEAIIAEIRQQIHAMGANDGEYVAIDDVLAKLRSGEYKPERAVEEAREVLSRKQDYH